MNSLYVNTSSLTWSEAVNRRAEQQFTNYQGCLEQKLQSILLDYIVHLCYKISPKIVGLGNELAVLV